MGCGTHLWMGLATEESRAKGEGGRRSLGEGWWLSAWLVKVCLFSALPFIPSNVCLPPVNHLSPTTPHLCLEPANYKLKENKPFLPFTSKHQVFCSSNKESI